MDNKIITYNGKFVVVNNKFIVKNTSKPEVIGKLVKFNDTSTVVNEVAILASGTVEDKMVIF